MPITEIVRTLCSAEGVDGNGRPVQVALVYDTDGTMGPDEKATGFPGFWLRVDGRSQGPFPDEATAIEQATCLYQACFG
ncbi:MAG: hypothetical protein CMP23_01350 [Rickettsiales bacterium]|nr:hypothetical protein [Rickettsiales bacterium]